MLAKGKSKPTRQQSLAAKPLQVVQGELADDGKGGARLEVTLKSSGWPSWLLRMPAGARKTFEFDSMGLLVWESCDGKTSVQQIIRKLGKQYDLNLREAEVATLKFLQTLAKKGLIGIAVKEGEVA